MGWTVAWAGRNLSAQELGEWRAYYAIEPRGENRIDYLIGMVASILANIHRDRKKRNDPFDWFNFIPWIKPPRNYLKTRLKRIIPKG